MNQILLTEKSKKLKKRINLVQFFIILFYTIFLVINTFKLKYSKKNEIELSKTTSKNYQLSRLYQNAPTSNVSLDNKYIKIIGTIAIPKINISYPIFSECSDELLKISVCRFYGPTPNKTGNLCIAGHNYENGIFFSNLFLLNIDDKIYIYDIYSNFLVYNIYSINEISPNDLSCISQDTAREKRSYASYL